MNWFRMTLIVALASLGLIASEDKAHAVPSCTISFSAVAFGSNIDVLSGASVDSAGTVTISCSNFGSNADANVVVCIGMNDGANATRQMASGANKLSYDLYTDAARATRWDNVQASNPGYVLTAATPSIAAPVYGRIAATQTTAPVGAYLDSITPSVFWNNFSGATPACSSLAKTIAVSTFQVTGTVTANCSVSATNLVFPQQSVIRNPVDAQSDIFVTCTTSAPYWIGLDGGSSAAADPTQRMMSRAGQTITYGLYRDPARLLPWGADKDVNTASGTGSAISTTFPVYGRIPAQSTPAPGMYQDTVVVTVNF
ncbi:MAG: spore coat protein u [Hyphomicrobiales bacterium]|jgi:spore coat protein U-like protein|nr:spore coat protein u [Hyphomicrobiales bacterium]